MKKKTYKAIQKRLLRATKAELVYKTKLDVSELERNRADEKAEYYQKRFRALGSKVETIETESESAVKMIKAEIKPEQYGNYILVADDITAEMTEAAKKELIKSIVAGLIENDMVQLIVKPADNKLGPLDVFGSIGAKLYVVPWEQMAERKTIEMRKFIDETLEREEQK